MVNKLTLLGFKGGDHSNRPPPWTRPGWREQDY